MTSLRRTPLVLAVASAFSFAALSAQAADVLIGSEHVPSTVEAEATWDAEWADKILGDAENKVVTVKPGEKGSPANVSIKEKGDLTIDISGTDAPKLVFSGAGLSLEGGKLTLGSDLTIQDKGALSFKGASALEIEKNTMLTLSDGTHDFALGTSADASIENAGTIVLTGKAKFNISAVAGETTADEKLDVINFGNVTVEGGSTLTNANTGYTVATEKSSDKSDGASGAEEGATENEASETLSLVEFGTVTVTGDGSKFVNAADAIDAGEALVLKDGGSAEILGSSTWEAVSVDLSGEKKSSIVLDENENSDGWKFSVGHLAIAHAGTGLRDVVSEKGKGEWSVSDALTITSFASSTDNGASFKLSSADKDHIGDGLDITVGSRLSANDVEFESSGDEGQPSLGIKTDADILTAGTFTVSGFAGTWTADQNESAGSEGAAGGDEEGAASQSEEAQKGEWSYQHFGAITVNDNMTFVFDSNKTTLPENAAEPYHAAVAVDSLSLNGSSIAASYDVPVESIAAFVQAKLEEKEIKDTIDFSDWTEKNLTEKLQALEEKYGSKDFSLLDALADAKEALEGKISGEFFTKPAVNAAQGRIKDSDLSIGKLSFGMNEVKKDIGDVSALLGEYAPNEDESGSSESGSGSGNAGAGTGQAGGNEGRADEEKPAEKPTYSESLTGELGAPELTITGSTVEVGTLSMSTGVIDASGSNLIVEKVDGKISGEIYFKEGFLGLNSVTSAADLKTAASSGDGDSAAKATAGNTLDVGAPVVIGAAGKLVIGTDQAGFSDVEDADGALVYFADNAEITFDASRFGTTALFSAELAQSGEAAGKTTGKGSVVVADGKTVNIKATNLSWGVYNIFDDETFDVTAGEEAGFTVEGSEASALWKDRVESAGKITVNEKGQMVVGGATVEGSGLDAVAAKNLVSAVIGGNRDGALDVALVNALMGSGSSIDDVVKTIDSVTGLGAIAGVNAMTVDLLAYTHDMIEHHASTIPLEGAGWWVMPLGGRMEADDLGLGGSTYGYSVDTYGLMGGLDVRVGSDWVVGAAGSYQTGDADSEGDVLDASTDVTNYGLHFWGARHYGDVKVTGTLSWMKTEGDAEMAVLGGKATADVKATAFAASLRADLRKSFGSFELIPHAGVRAAMIDIDDYDIRFNEADLFSVDEDKIVVFEVPVGVTAATSFELQKWTVRPYADVTLRGRFGDTDSSYTLTGSSTKDTIGYDVAGDFAGDLKLGWMSTHKDLNLGMSYGFSAGDAGRQAHRIEATMRVLFD